MHLPIPRKGTETFETQGGLCEPGLLELHLPIPRKGTETLLSYRPRGQKQQVALTYSPQGDGNMPCFAKRARVNPRNNVALTYSPQGDGNILVHFWTSSRFLVALTYSPQGDGNTFTIFVKSPPKSCCTYLFPARGRKLLKFGRCALMPSSCTYLFPARGRKHSVSNS